MSFKIKNIVCILCGILLIGCGKEGAVDKNNKTQQASYAIGQSIGKNFLSQNIEVHSDSLFKGIKDALAGKSDLSTENIQQVLSQFQKEQMSKQEQKMKGAAEKNLGLSKQYLEANKAKKDVVTLPSGLQYKLLKKGSGLKSPSETDMVTVHYVGTLVNGTEFDSSIKRGEPATFQVNGVIKGWTEALKMMKVGDKYQLFIPPDLGYGERGAGSMIEPNVVLVFEVELLDIKPGK